MGRFTDLQTQNAFNTFNQNPTPENQLNFLRWRKRQLEESGGFNFFTQCSNCECAPEGSNDKSKCFEVRDNYPNVLKAINEVEQTISKRNEIPPEPESLRIATKGLITFEQPSNNTLRNSLLIGGALALLL